MKTNIKTAVGTIAIGVFVVLLTTFVGGQLKDYLPTIPFSTYTATAINSLDDGLIAHYTFDEGSGTIANDSSGNGNTGTLVNNPTWVSGRVGSGALQFNGSTQSVALPASSPLLSPGSGDMTISAWVYWNSTTGVQFIYDDQGNPGTNSAISCGISTTANPSATFKDETNNLTTTVSANSVTTNNWYYVSCVKNGTTAKVYINGVLKSSFSNTSIGNISVNNGWAPHIGSYITGTSNIFKGSIDDLRIYNRALSSDEVNSLYIDGGGTPPPPGDTTPPSISNITSSSISSSGATISWTTDENSDSQVEYGLNTSYGNSTNLNTSLTTQHSVVLSALSASTHYHYRVKSRDVSGNLATSNDQIFTTSGSDGSPPPAENGQVIVASSCSQSDVQAAVDLSQDGDTVQIPAGTCIWSSPVKIGQNVWTGGQNVQYGKKLIVLGHGIDQTIIINAIPQITTGLQEDSPFIVYTEDGKPFRITGFTFEQDASVPTVTLSGIIHLVGTSKEIRIDHNKFLNLRSRSIFISGYQFGVIDHNQFNTAIQPIWAGDMVGYDGKPGVGGDASWASPLSLGSNEAIYIEDNVAVRTNSAFGSALGFDDSRGGGRQVIRYNSFTDMNVQNHGTDSSGRLRGTFSYEVYNNTFNLSPGVGGDGFYVRSGTGVFYNNTLNGNFSAAVRLNNFRSFNIYSNTPFNTCDGTNVYDENDGVVYDSGSHTGPHTSMDPGSLHGGILSDSNKNWNTNQWIGYSIRNTTKNWGSEIISNTSNSITPDLSSFGDQSWDTGDSYQILRASICLDQIGRSTGDLFSTDFNNPLPQTWPHQSLEPYYIWNNTLNGAPSNVTTVHGYTIQQNRDYYVGTPRPGYTPYTYPHPLTLTGFTSDASTTPLILPPPPSGGGGSSGGGGGGGGGSSGGTTTPPPVVVPPGTLPPGCNPGDNFSALTGQPCSTLPPITPPGCLPIYLFSPITGQPCGGSSVPSASGSTTFTRDLSFGSIGDDVTQLQNILIAQGYLAEGLNIGIFGSRTRAALASYQQAHGIQPAVGYFGPITRGSLNNY